MLAEGCWTGIDHERLATLTTMLHLAAADVVRMQHEPFELVTPLGRSRRFPVLRRSGQNAHTYMYVKHAAEHTWHVQLRLVPIYVEFQGSK